MPQRHLEQVHGHRTIDQQIRLEYSEDGRLHRHRVVDTNQAVRYTTWAHNSPAHQHRLPNGSWTRPRFGLTPPEVARAAGA